MDAKFYRYLAFLILHLLMECAAAFEIHSQVRILYTDWIV